MRWFWTEWLEMIDMNHSEENLGHISSPLASHPFPPAHPAVWVGHRLGAHAGGAGVRSTRYDPISIRVIDMGDLNGDRASMGCR